MMVTARKCIVFSRTLGYPLNPNPNPPSYSRHPLYPSPTFPPLLQNPIFPSNPNPNTTSVPIPFQSTMKSVPYPLPYRNPNPLSFLRCCSRLLSTSARMPRIRPGRRSSTPTVPRIGSDQLTEIVELVRKDAGDLEQKLEQMNPRLSQAALSDALRDLNCFNVSALRFFNWVLNANSDFQSSAEIYNLVIDNLGRVGDYNTMLLLLNELSLKGHCLTEKAFAFLTSRGSSGIEESVRSVVGTLNRVAGSCRNSGIHSLIKLLCLMNAYDLAVSVMEETTRRTSYYNLLIAAKCRGGDFQGAHEVFDEMKRFRCDPNINSYNYLLGSLFKKGRVVEACDLMELMEKLACRPNSVTFEIVMYHACKANRMEFAIECLDRMLAEGLKPRRTTHAAFVKGYFWSGRLEDAHKYVVDMTVRDKCSGNLNYSLLASLYHISRQTIEAGMVLKEMMEKGLRPCFPVYRKVAKDLLEMNRGDLASQIKSMFSKFNSSIDDG